MTGTVTLTVTPIIDSGAVKISGQDVSEEYLDLEARLRTKKALEAQFLEIMKQARKVQDALDVQSQLADVRTEIERLEGRRRFLENQAALSTITTTLQMPQPIIAAHLPDASELPRIPPPVNSIESAVKVIESTTRPVETLTGPTPLPPADPSKQVAVPPLSQARAEPAENAMPRREELAPFAQQVCRLRYRATREEREGRSFAIWSFAVIEDLRGGEDR